jgi:hypothetical protein
MDKTLNKAERILLDKLHERFPSLKYVLADLLKGERVCDIRKKYDINEQSIRNLKHRYKKELEDYASEEKW